MITVMGEWSFVYALIGVVQSKLHVPQQHLKGAIEGRLLVLVEALVDDRTTLQFMEVGPGEGTSHFDGLM